MTKQQLFNKVKNFLGSLTNDKEAFCKKFDNICKKTGRYDVPEELYQKRTNRKNRVLIPWKTVKNNGLTIEDLELFEGGVAVEFVNNDYFDELDSGNSVFDVLKEKLGSDDNVSAIISIRSEGGSASSAVQRDAYQKMIREFSNFQDLLIHRKQDVEYTGCGNDVWTGFIYFSIRGGQQDTSQSHPKGEKGPQLFNPACEYASEAVCEDINLVLVYFALNSVSEEDCNTEEQKAKLADFREKVEEQLRITKYDGIDNLLDYCTKHPCLAFGDGKLVDPIQMTHINIKDFANKVREDDALDLTHDEAVNKDRFFIDSEQHTIVGPSRPTNLFWSKKLSNMMQQDKSLEEFFEYEENIVEKRRAKLNHD